MIKRLIFMVVAVVAVGGCASNGAAPEPPAEPACISDTFPSEPDFVGLDLTAAEELASQRGLQVREVGRDGECFVVTEDLRQDRINLEFTGDKVIAAAIY